MNIDGLIEHCGGVSDLVRGGPVDSVPTDKMEALFQAQRKLETALAEVGIHGPHVAQTRLQLRLENDEPKCANCKQWARMVHAPHIGQCLKGNTSEGPTLTTDLTVCAAWEPRT